MALAQLADRLRELHAGPQPVVLPNAWDVASALAVERAGALAVATTSSGVAASLGYPDGEAIPAEEMFDMVARIAAAVGVPVTADVEAGYGLPTADLVDRLLSAGAAGLNLEDTERTAGQPNLVETDDQARRIRDVQAAGEAAGVPLVTNARIDAFLRAAGSHHDVMTAALERARAYLEAGADCVYPIMLSDRDLIGRFVREAGGPVNILLRPGSPSLAGLHALGVRRVSVGGGLWRHAMRAAETVARELLAGQDAAFAELGED